jgi:hypothetical protein
MRMRMRFLASAAILGAALAVTSAPDPASAAPVSWEVEGTVRVLSGGFPTEILWDLVDLNVQPPDARLSLSFAFDPDAGDLNPDPSIGSYFPAVISADVTLGDWHLTGITGSVEIGSPVDGMGIFPDAYAVTWVFRLSDSTGITDEDPVLLVRLVTLDPSIFPTDAIPLDPPDLGDLLPYGTQYEAGTSGIFYDFGTEAFMNPCTAFGQDCAEIEVELTSLRRVPESGAVALLGPVVFALFASRRR